MNKNIPIIDLFAGPGGLGEGFSAVLNKNSDSAFKIKLSIEKDINAHKTLEFRSFFRQFPKGEAPVEYYEVLKESNIVKREILKDVLFNKYISKYESAKQEAWKAELGHENFHPDIIDERIKKSLNDVENWVLIGGPPCQAYSLAGRSRVGGIDEKDHRVYLYKEYLRIIAKHHPTAFVMENVKGLLSAKINGDRVFDWILRDLNNPSLIFPELSSPKYKIYSLSTEPVDYDLLNNPVYKNHNDYLIKSENFGIPQKRHRVILLGIRDDINVTPEILKKCKRPVTLKEVIDDLPKIRSGLNRSFHSSEIIRGRKKRYYKKVEDSDKNWRKITTSFMKEILSWNGFSSSYMSESCNPFLDGTGSEYLTCDSPSPKNPLFDWYYDENLNGVCNHKSRSHLVQDLKRYMFSSIFAKTNNRFPRLNEFGNHSKKLLPDHENAMSGKFTDRFRVQLADQPATTVTSHISKDGHYFIHYDPEQCRSLTVREASRIQTFPDNYLFCGSRTAQYHQVGNAVPPLLAKQIGEIVFKVFNIYHSR